MRLACLLALMIAVAAPAAAQRADYSLTGEITGADNQTYRQVPFDVPAGVERITVTLAYDKTNKTVIDLGLWDPERFRGWSGGTRDRLTVSASDASPGYLAGSIPAGRWHVQFGIPNARTGSHAAYKVEVFFDRDKARQATAAIADPPIRTEAGWYRGDLHMHDAHSDGSCPSQSGKRVPCPLFRTVAAAADAGLDFIAVTDHNTVAHFGGLRELQPLFDRMLLIPGIEVTTFHGHAGVLGASRWIDFRVGTPGVRDIAALERDVAASGAILSLNHPAAPSGEICMGCGWTAPGTDFAGITAVEVVNGKIAEGPYGGLGFWYARLNEGHRLTGIGSSDNHDPEAPDGKAPIGQPRTVVHVPQLSTPAILAGIRAGNVFIDAEGTRDRLLEVAAVSDGRRATMGETLEPGRAVAVEVHVAHLAAGTIEVIANGGKLASRPVSGPDQRLSVEIARARACGWLSVNVRGGAGELLLIGNPIYIRCAKHQPANR